jgi:ribosomal protein S27AE
VSLELGLFIKFATIELDLKKIFRKIITMKSNYLHTFLEKILQTAVCPRCGEKISLEEISVEYCTTSSCFFRISCGVCGSHGTAQAVLGKPTLQNLPRDFFASEIQESEVKNLENILQKTTWEDFCKMVSNAQMTSKLV